VVAHSKNRPKGTKTIVSNGKTLYSPKQKKPTANPLYALWDPHDFPSK